MAIERDNVECVKALLELGANPHLATLEETPESAFAIALRRRDYFINRTLEDWQNDRLERQKLRDSLLTSSSTTPMPDHKIGEEKNVCNVCMERKINTVILECGHSSLCMECATPLVDCPICRSKIVRIVKIFTT